MVGGDVSPVCGLAVGSRDGFRGQVRGQAGRAGLRGRRRSPHANGRRPEGEGEAPRSDGSDCGRMCLLSASGESGQRCWRQLAPNDPNLDSCRQSPGCEFRTDAIQTSRKASQKSSTERQSYV